VEEKNESTQEEVEKLKAEQPRIEEETQQITQQDTVEVHVEERTDDGLEIKVEVERI
jgi:hypothetical protein